MSEIVSNIIYRYGYKKVMACLPIIRLVRYDLSPLFFLSLSRMLNCKFEMDLRLCFLQILPFMQSFSLITSFPYSPNVWTNVLKTGLDRPVWPIRPLVGHRSGPVRSFGPDGDRTGVGPVEPTVQPVNRTNRPIRLILIFF